MLHEIDLLASLRHPDLVLFLGACLDPGHPIMFVSEFMGGGDLENYMRKMREQQQAYSAPQPIPLRPLCPRTLIIVILLGPLIVTLVER